MTAPDRVQARRRPCADCPWRMDVPVGKFPPERFVAIADTSYDVAVTQFACHRGKTDDMLCIGFALTGATHNLGFRLSEVDPRQFSSPWPLYTSFRAMAVANGVDPDDPALARSRDL